MLLFGTNRQQLMVPKRPPFWFPMLLPAKSRLLPLRVVKGIPMMVTASTDKTWHRHLSLVVREDPYRMFLEEMTRRRIIISRHQNPVAADVKLLQTRRFLA